MLPRFVIIRHRAIFGVETVFHVNPIALTPFMRSGLSGWSENEISAVECNRLAIRVLLSHCYFEIPSQLTYLYR
jgi:hypothetical protein